MDSRAALLAVCLTGCVNSFEPDVGPPLRDLCVNEDSDPTIPVSFATDIMVSVFGASGCLDCHLPGGIGLEASGLDLSTYAGATSGGQVSGSDIVMPEVPCNSVLWQKVSPAPPFGARMPIGRPPLSQAQLLLVRDWIAEGALDN